MTYAEYLDLERRSPEKHEYVQGEVRAMGGVTPSHAQIAANVILGLSAFLKGRPCGVFSSDLRVRVVETNRSTYPDVTVVCGKRQLASDDDDAVVNPIVIVVRPPPAAPLPQGVRPGQSAGAAHRGISAR